MYVHTVHICMYVCIKRHLYIHMCTFIMGLSFDKVRAVVKIFDFGFVCITQK